MSSTHPSDSWSRGDPYERYVGRWSQRGAREFLDWLNHPLPDATVDVVVSGLVLNFVSDTALAQVRRTAVAGGTIVAYVWDYAAKMELMRYFWDAAVELNSAAHELDEGIRFPLCRAEVLEPAFQTAKLSAVQLRPIDIATRFSDFDDYWAPFLGGQGPAPGPFRAECRLDARP